MEKEPRDLGTIGILESWEICDYNSRKAVLIIDGKESTMKYGELSSLVYRIPDSIWPVWGEETNFDLICKEHPNWPIGGKVKHYHGEIVALWIPTKKVWLRRKWV